MESGVTGRLEPASNPGPGKGGLWLVPAVLALTLVDVVTVVARSAEMPSTGDLRVALWAVPSPWLPMADLGERGNSKQFVGCSWRKMDAKRTTPTSQGRPEIKYLLQGGLSKPSEPLGTSLAPRTLFRARVTIGQVSFM